MKKAIILIVFFSFFGTTIYAQEDSEQLILGHFQGNLSEVLASLSKRYDLKVAFNHSALKAYSVNATIEKQTPKDALKILIESTNLELVQIRDKYIIREKLKSKKNNISLSGKVVDMETGEALPYTHLKIQSYSIGTTTNQDGYFSFLNLPSDTCEVQASYLGYELYSERVRAINNKDEVTIIRLKPQTDYLEEVIVEQTRYLELANQSTVSAARLTPTMMQQLPSLGEPDIFKSLQMLPGISASNETSSGLNIRASLPSQNLILLDDFTVYHLDHFFGVFSAINPNIVKSVNVYKGGYGPEYGGRVGGVVDIISKTGNQHKVSGKFSANFINANGILEIPLGKKASVVLAGRRSYTDVIRSPLYKKIINTARENNEENIGLQDRSLFQDIEPDFYYYDLNVKFNYQPTEKDAISFSFFQSNDNLTNSFEESIENEPIDFFFQEKNKWGNDGLNLRWARQWTPKYNSKLHVSYSDYFNNYAFNDDVFDGNLGLDLSYQFIQENNVEDLSIKFENAIQLNDNFSFNFGIANNQYHLTFIQQVDEFMTDEPIDEKGSISSINGQMVYSHLNKLNVLLGSRVSVNDWDNTVYVEPRVSLNYHLNPSFMLKGAFSQHAQFVKQVTFSNPIAGTLNYWLLADDEVAVTKAKHYIIGGNWEINGWLFDVELYHKELQGINQHILNQETSLFAPEIEGFIGVGDERVFGVDVLLQKEIGNYKGWIAYTLSNAKQRFVEVNNNQFFPSLQDQRHELKSAHIYTTSKVDVSLLGVFATGRPYEFHQILSVDNETGDIFYLKDFSNSRRLKNYFRVDASANYKFNFSEKIKAKAGVTLINLFNHQNIRSRRIDSNAIFLNQTEFFYRDLSLLDFTPTVFFEVAF